MVSRLFSRVQDGGSGCANEESLSPFHPNMMLQTLPAQNSDYPDWSGGRIEPEKELWRNWMEENLQGWVEFNTSEKRTIENTRIRSLVA